MKQGRRKGRQWTREGQRRVNRRSGAVIPFLRCEKKRRYRAQSRANEERKRMEQRTGIQFSTYACPHCGGWHIGRQKYYEGGLTYYKKVEKEI